MQGIVDQRCQQIVRRRDCVEITGEVQVDLFHGQDLRLTAAGGAALAPKHRAKRRLAQCDHRLATDMVQSIAKPDRGGGFAFARGSRVDRGDQHQLAARAAGQRGKPAGRQFGDMMTIRFDRVGPQPCTLSYFSDRSQGSGAGDFDVTGHGGGCLLEICFAGSSLNADMNHATQSVGTESGDFRWQINHREFGFFR